MVFKNYRPKIANAWLLLACSLAIICLMSLVQQTAQAQTDIVDQSGLLGVWQKKGEALVIEFEQNEDQSFSAKVLRADWEPGKVGEVFIQGVVPDFDQKRWDAQVFDFNRGEFREGSISKSKQDRFSLRAAGQRRSTWIRIPSAKDLL